MPKERDPFRKYVDDLKNRKWKCKFCGAEFAGSTPRIRAHLAGIPGYGIKPCEKVEDPVRAEALETFNGKGIALDVSTGGTSGKRTERTVLGTSQSVLPSDDASNPNHMQNSIQLGCVPQQPSFYQPTGTRAAPACPQDDDALNPNHTQNSNQLGCTPQQPSFYQPTGTGTAPACPQYQVPLPPGEMPLDNLDNTQQSNPSNHMLDAAHGNEIASPFRQPSMDWSPLPSLDPNELPALLGGDVLPTLLLRDMTTNSIPPNSNEQYPGFAERFADEVILDSLVDSTENLHFSPPENPPELPDVIANDSEEIGLQEFTGELDMNKGAPMTSHPNTGSNLEKNRDLKRKLDLLYRKEASIRDELEFAASLSLKKPRMEVANWLVNVEKLRNDCPEATSEDCLPPQEQVDKLMHEAEDLMRQRKGLFEARETKVNKLLEKEMAGEAFWRNTTKILEYLLGNQISRLGIYGMGGVGKTTIMVHIHNRLLEEANYGEVLWITVSRDFNIQRLQDAIAKVLGLGILEETDVRKRAAMLCDCLTKRGKSTIILDDVWEHFDPKEVGIPVRAYAIKLVLTTRSFEVCRQMQCQEMIKIEPLYHIEAERLFFKELGSEVALNLETEAIVKSIVKECAGLPLAIITMARSMRGVTDAFEWKDCLEKFRESDLGLTDMEKEVLMKLQFSYNRLGNDEVQQCFLSCTFYPEDELIDKFELIELFIDQGLIGRLSTREKQYDRGQTILNKLENVCLLEDHGSAMKMHDLIRDMALQIIRAIAIVKAGKGLRRIPSEDYWTDALEKVSLMQNEIGEFPLNMSPNCPKLSTFLLNANYVNDVFIPDSFFKQLWGLKVLNLSGCNLRELPNSISGLVNLRALLLRYCRRLRCIPCLGKLRYLRKLDIYECASLELIIELEMLVNLRYLDLSGTRIERLPKGTLGALLNLQYLKVEVANEDVTKLWALETLECSFEDVDDFNKFVRVLSKQRNNPHYYKLDVHEEASGIYVQVSDDARFRNYDRSVHIKAWSYAIVSAGGESNGNCILIPQNVRSLTASNCNGTTKFSDVGPLEDLEELNISGWENLWVLCGGQDEEIIDICDSLAPTPASLAPTPASLIFPSLRVLEISGCPKLMYLFMHRPKFSLPRLQRIEIAFCHKMVGIAVADSSPPSHLPPAFPSLENILVLSCSKMKTVVDLEGLRHFPNLRKIEVYSCKNMKVIFGDRSPYICAEKIFLERLLEAGCFDNMGYLSPHDLMLLKRKEMLEMISKARQSQEGSTLTLVNNTPLSSESSISLPKLKHMCLGGLTQLKSICDVPIACDSMERLEVTYCPELNGTPLQLLLRDTEDLLRCKVVLDGNMVVSCRNVEDVDMRSPRASAD